MQHLGELISLAVAVSWTVTALFADKASHRLGPTTANVLRPYALIYRQHIRLREVLGVAVSMVGVALFFLPVFG